MVHHPGPPASQNRVLHPERGAQRGAGIPGRRLDVQPLDPGALEQLAVGDAVHGTTAGEAEVDEARPPSERSHQREQPILEHLLE